VGNVRIDGKNLTTGAIAQQPMANSMGWIGWVDCSERNHPNTLRVVNGVPIGDRLILRKPDTSLMTITSGKPIIEQWSFDPDGLHVIIKSRALHGPAVIERLRIKDGSKKGACLAYETNAPAWAKPYLDR
jgi:hypothetical protein